jgi:hypothetical protein
MFEAGPKGPASYVFGRLTPDRHAEKRGLFVLKCGEGATSIENAPDFRPKAF